MAKDNIFEQDLQLQGIAKILNLRLDVLASISGEPIVNKQGGLYFDSDEESLRVNVDGTNWYSSVLFNGTSDDVATLPVFMADELNKVEKFMNPSTGPQLVYLDSTSEVKLIEKINFTHFLDSAIYTADYTDIAAGETLLPTAGAVYDYVNATIVGSGGLLDDYLPLAGGEMVGNILMDGEYNIYFKVLENFIRGTTTVLTVSSKSYTSFIVNEIPVLKLFGASILPYVSDDYDLGSNSYKFQNGYFGTTVFTPKLSGNGALLTIVGGAYDDTKIEIGGDQVMFYDHIYPNTTVSRDMGSGSTRWRNAYFSRLDTFNLYINSTTAYVNEIVTTIDLAEPSGYAIATELAVKTLFSTIETITGATITNMETVGMVTRFSGVNPENYYLAGDNTWNSLVWLVSDTTLGLNSSLGITDFEFIAKETVAFGVKGSYTQLSYYDGDQYVLYLGDVGTSLLTDFTYFTELVGDMRTTSSIWFGGTLSTAGVVEVTDAAISAVPVLSISTAIDCEGISTDGTNIWKLLGTVTGTSITPSDLLVVTINGVYYKIVAQEFTPAP